jgi:predicted lipid-binding transport protein (Tim44 family)
MKKFLTLFLAVFIGFALVVHDADARRFGGGSSFGKQRSVTPQSTPQAAPQRPAQPPAAAPAPTGNRWLGPLAGLAAGGLLAAMFMGHGFDGIKFMDILMIIALIAAVMFIFRALRRPQRQPLQYAGLGGQEPMAMAPVAGGTAAAPSTRPAWFEDEPFLREAKRHFIRLQADYDAKDLKDIQEYCTPEVYAEIVLQVQERGDQPNKTEVVTLNAEMADVATENDLVVASVRFSGMIREEEGQPAQPFDEIWHIQKSLTQPNASWLVAGIQQVQ